jgi:hypothetical protein
MRILVFCIDKESTMRRRTLLSMGITAIVVVACATPDTKPLTGPGLIFVYTDN